MKTTLFRPRDRRRVTDARVTGCSLELGSRQSGDAVNVVIGYQSKTINTVTAGTLLRAQGYLEQRLPTSPTSTGTKYNVEWQDYDTGAPITAQMVAEKIDIGSMGDYPMLINGSKTQANDRARNGDRLGHRLQPQGRAEHGRGAAGFAGRPRSPTWPARRCPRASAPPATAPWCRRSTAPASTRRPASRCSTSSRRSVPRHWNPVRWQALSQFVAWPGLLVFQDKAKLLYDGAELELPDPARGGGPPRRTPTQHPEVLDAFLQAQLDATEFLHDEPLEAARIVAEGSGLPQEVVYLYNGPGGTSFDTTLKPGAGRGAKGRCAVPEVDRRLRRPRRRRLRRRRVRSGRRSQDRRPGLRRRAGVHGQPDVAHRHRPGVRPSRSAIRRWPRSSGSTAPTRRTGRQPRRACCGRSARPNAEGSTVRAAYVPDAELGTRWFADKSVWVRDGANFLPFGTPAGAQRLPRARTRAPRSRLPRRRWWCGMTTAPAVAAADRPTSLPTDASGIDAPRSRRGGRRLVRIASVLAAIGAVAGADRQRCSAVAAVRHAADRHRDRRRRSAPASARRTTGSTSGSR